MSVPWLVVGVALGVGGLSAWMTRLGLSWLVGPLGRAEAPTRPPSVVPVVGVFLMKLLFLGTVVAVWGVGPRASGDKLWGVLGYLVGFLGVLILGGLAAAGRVKNQP